MTPVDPLGICREEVENSLRRALAELELELKAIDLEIPHREHGDFAFSCFTLAKLVKKPPAEIARDIAAVITLGEHIGGLSQKGPYLNFIINPKKLTAMTLKAIFGLGDSYGDSLKKARRIILEHTSANPTDKLHIGRARNPIIGDTLARILRKAGFFVETQFYVDDMGKQAVTLAYGIEIWEKRPKDDDSLGPYQYASKMVLEDQEMERVRDEWLGKLEGGDKNITRKVRLACEKVLREDIVTSLTKIHVSVDRYVHESQFVMDGSVDGVIEALKSSQHCGTEEGAYYIDLKPFTGSEARFFFQRADGTSLYATRDIAYHLWKFRHCDDAINILGEDHKLESEQVRAGLSIMGQERFPESIFYSFVSLPEGRMSTRKGKVVFLDDLISEAEELARAEVKKRREDLLEDKMREIAEDVAIGAIRYNIVRVQPEKKIVFRWEDALNFEGNSAPFIQYSHARASSILRKAKEEGMGDSFGFEPDLLNHPAETAFIREMAGFPSVIKECAERRSPHIMAAYAYSLASSFNQFYRDCPVLAAKESEQRSSRLALVLAGQTVIKNALFCLGIAAPDTM